MNRENIGVKVAYEHGGTKPVETQAVTATVSLFNYANYVTECLDSIARSDHPALDLIVVDDASDRDDSVQVVADWLQRNSDRFRRTTLLVHEYNQGLAQARNTGFEHARTDAVFVIDADNQVYPRALSQLATVLRSGDYALAYSQLELFGDSRELGFANYWNPGWLARGNYIDAMAMVSKEAWQEVGGYTHIEGGWEDYDLWCKFVEHNMRGVFVPEILCRYRYHRQSMLRTETDYVEDTLRVTMTLRHPWMKLSEAKSIKT